MTDTRIRRLQQDLTNYASSDTLDLTLDSSGIYDPQFTEPIPWGQPQQPSAAPTPEATEATGAREVTPASATPSVAPKPRRRWQGGGSPAPAPEPPPAPAETKVTVPRNPQSPVAEEPRNTWAGALSVGPRPKLNLKINRTVRRLGQDLPWCAVAIWIHLLTVGRPLMTTLVTGGLYVAILFWIWLILKNWDDKAPAVVKTNAVIFAAVALSAVLTQRPLICGVTFLASYFSIGDHSHQGWPLVLSRVLVPIILSWPLASILVWFKLFG